MLTLNQTPGNNSDSIWVMRLRGEGNNLVTNGGFDSSDGWTMSGDWAISGGVADYTYVDDMTGSIYRTISSVTAESYTLEYEIIENNTTTNILYLIGSGSYIISATYMLLDATVGKHSINIKCVNSTTTIGFYISGSAPGKTLKLDNIKLRKFDNITYIATRDISLDNNYIGKILNRENNLTEISFESTTESSGGCGNVTSFTINISRYISESSLTDFFNSFYPSSDGGFIVGRVIDLGVVWTGATTDAEITWLFRGRIIDYSYLQRQLQLVIFQESEITNKELPYYSIQKDFNNGVSYYTNAPTENLGLSIPIVYGSFDRTSLAFNIKQLFPSPCIDKRYLIFAQSSHKLYSQNHPGFTNSLFKYIDSLDTYMVLIPDNGTSNNYNYISRVQLYSPSRVSSESVYGRLYLVPKGIGKTSDVNDIENILNDTDTTYVVLNDADELGVKLASGSSGDVGILGQLTNDIRFFVEWQSTNGDQRQIALRGYNEALGTPAYVNLAVENTTLTGAGWELTELGLGDYITNKSNADLPWTIEEICSMSYVAINNSGAGGAVSGDINIRVAYVLLNNIIVVGTFKKSNVRALSGSGGYI
jgi:hypothetical protein